MYSDPVSVIPVAAQKVLEEAERAAGGLASSQTGFHVLPLDVGEG